MRQLIGMLLACSIAFALASAQLLRNDPSTAADEIATIKVRLADAMHSKRLDDIPLLFAPDGSFLSRTTGRVTGRDAIRGLFEKVLSSYSSEITLTSLHIERSKDLAFDSGDFEETVTAVSDGKKYEVKGSYLMVFRRQRDGRWLIVEQVMTDRTQVSR